MADFLFEIGLEEVPARMIAGAQAELQKRVVALLEREHLLAATPTHDDEAVMNGAPKVFNYSTPRRLAVVVKGVLVQQPDITEETTGPAVKIAFKDGVATPAAEAFARKSGVSVADLRRIETPKGEYLAATSVKQGRSAAVVIAEELPKELAGLYWAKNMRWIPDSNEKFVRPVVWMVCLLGDAVVPVSFGGKTAERASYGHRVLSSGEAFEVQAPESYVAQLEGEYVLADVGVRRQKIRKALDHVTRTMPGARWREDEALVDAVTHLTEWPDVLLGSFEAAYLKLPEEVLVTVMRDHQKYFAVEDADHKLLPHFLTVTNIALSEANTPVIKQGNERVLRARFNDAKFFWEFDQRTSLERRIELLENVTFQKELGSYAEKARRMVSIAHNLMTATAAAGGERVDGSIFQAVRLAKTDLTTDLVKEFTELQGVIGGLYARSQGEDVVVADAIYDQYLPGSAKDRIPRSAVGCILGLADRIDTVAGMFGLGMEPSGSKDPFALRRAANAMVRILAESSLSIKLSELIAATDASPEVTIKLESFFKERVDFYLREGCGQSYDVVKAVMAAGFDDLKDLVMRARAVTEARGSADFTAVSAAFKRMKGILAQAADKGIEPAWFVDSGLFKDEAEDNLMKHAHGVGFMLDRLRKEQNYPVALEAVAQLRPVVDAFFEKVMIFVDDEALRANRLKLLAQVLEQLSGIADFSEIVTAR